MILPSVFFGGIHHYLPLISTHVKYKQVNMQNLQQTAILWRADAGRWSKPKTQDFRRRDFAV
jgi:hypothetical protein